MRTVLLCKDNQDYTRDLLTWLKDFEYQAGEGIMEVLDPEESSDGEDLARSYDLLEYPAVLVIANDGSVVQMWKGMPLPPVEEVSYFAKQ